MDPSLYTDAIGYGLIGLAAYAFAEKFFPFMPSCPFLIFVGMSGGGQIDSVGLSLFAVTIGSALGATALFGAASILDEQSIRTLVRRFGKLVLLPVERYDRLIDSYRRHHFSTTLLGQFVPLARNYSALSAAIVGVAFLPFLTATILGAMVWNAAFLLIGYYIAKLL